MNEVSIDLYEPSNNETPRYTIHILDQKPNRENGRYAAFIVPQGRETEWLFSTQQGRRKLLASAKNDRLAIVSMHRGHLYKSWDDVQNELSASIRNFAPNGLKNQQVVVEYILFFYFNEINCMRSRVFGHYRFHFFRLVRMLAHGKQYSMAKVNFPAITSLKKSRVRTTKYFVDSFFLAISLSFSQKRWSKLVRHIFFDTFILTQSIFPSNDDWYLRFQ